MLSRLLGAPLLRSPSVGLFCAPHSQARLLSATSAQLKRADKPKDSAASENSNQDGNSVHSKPSESVGDNGDSTATKSTKRRIKAEKEQTPSTEDVNESDAISLISSLTARLAKLENSQATKNATAKPVIETKTKRKRRASPVRRVATKEEIGTPAAQTLRDAMQGSSLKEKATQELDDDLEKAIKREDQWREAVKNQPIQTLSANDLDFQPVDVEIQPIPRLAHGLDRVLFNPSVYRLQDPRSRVYNFDPYLEKIMPIKEFDFGALSAYTTSSRDEKLLAITRQSGVKFTGSTSSMSGVLQHFHYLLSSWRNLNHVALSHQFARPAKSFTKITVGPQAIFLRWKDGVYAVDADKSFDSPNIMSWLGHSMEKLLTSTPEEFERYRRSNPELPPSEVESGKSYHYSKLGNFLMRSQLDAQDTRLPGTGVFDLKTRAVLPIRMNHANHEQGAGYQLRYSKGEYESFEREDYDMARATMLKYMLQVRMGRMDGIFVAYHNVERIFGFRYLSISDLDYILHGQSDTSLGDKEFKMSIGLLDEILQRATSQFPGTSIRLHFETGLGTYPPMSIFAEPVTEEQVEEIQSSNAEIAKEFEQTHVFGDHENVHRKRIEEINEENSAEETTLTSNAETTKSDVSKQDTSATRSETPTSGPLKGWTLTSRNLVNGEAVARPENIRDSDDYSIEYLIQDIAAAQAPVLYKKLKERRSALFNRDPDEDPTAMDSFRARIHEYTMKGRDWREEQDKIDEQLGQRIYRPLGPGSGEVVEEKDS